MFTFFYYVDDKYIEFLQCREKGSRGFTCVPNVCYANKEKFVYGVVMEVQSGKLAIPYFVPVTSYSERKMDNILLRIKHKKKIKNVGSLRFNYMIPVPLKCVKRMDFSKSGFTNDYRMLLEQEYRYIKKTIGPAAIQRQAKRTYERVLNGNDENLKRNSCDFKLLEEAYHEYLVILNQEEKEKSEKNKTENIP